MKLGHYSKQTQSRAALKSIGDMSEAYEAGCRRCPLSTWYKYITASKIVEFQSSVVVVLKSQVKKISGQDKAGRPRQTGYTFQARSE